MSIVSNSLKRVKPSPTMAVTSKAREMRAAGKDVIGSVSYTHLTLPTKA